MAVDLDGLEKPTQEHLSRLLFKATENVRKKQADLNLWPNWMISVNSEVMSYSFWMDPKYDIQSCQKAIAFNMDSRVLLAVLTGEIHWNDACKYMFRRRYPDEDNDEVDLLMCFLHV